MSHTSEKVRSTPERGSTPRACTRYEDAGDCGPDMEPVAPITVNFTRFPHRC